MRTIKFRAWNPDPTWKKMYYEFIIDSRGKVSNVSDSGYLLHISVEDFIPMQFTGLLDKNGKEIYEGDILSLWLIQREGFPRAKCEVVWDEDRWSVPNWHNGLTPFAKIVQPEVIGNIYENPELLKK